MGLQGACVTIESVLDPFVLLSSVCDDSGVIIDFACVEANRAACDYCTSDIELLRGRLVGDFGGAGVLSALARVVDSGETLALEDQPYANPLLNGAERWYDARVARFGDGVSVTWRDTTGRHVAQAMLAEREERYRLLAENASDLVYFADVNGRATWVAPTVTHSLGWTPEEIVGTVVTDLIHPDDWDVAAALREVAETGTHLVALQQGVEHPVLTRMRHRDGSYRWMSVSATLVHAHADRHSGVVVGMRDVTELIATQELAERGRLDDLTGLVNRPSLLERMDRIIAGGRRSTDQHAVLFCDVDNFKEINDTYGHAVGDEVLRAVAARIRRSVREHDVVARLGGDEFVVVLDGIRDAFDAEAVAEKIRRAISDPLIVDGLDVSRSFSIGVAMVRPDSTPERVLRDADAALYEAKESGRDRTVIHRGVPVTNR